MLLDLAQTRTAPSAGYRKYAVASYLSVVYAAAFPIYLSSTFESDEAARQNSDRPEQAAWWDQAAALFTDEQQHIGRGRHCR